MGWLFPYGMSRSELIDHCLRSWSSPGASGRCVARCTRGNILWAVWENYVQATGHFERVILCIMLQRSKDGWGYKDIDESMGPFYYTCPLKYLNMGTRVLCKDWREGVREYHAKQKNKRERRKHIREAIPVWPSRFNV